MSIFSEQTAVCRQCGRAKEPKYISCPGCGLFYNHAPGALNLPDYLNDRQISGVGLKQKGIAVVETTYLALGGGLGSFTWVDYLRVCGASTRQIVVIGRDPIPYARFRQLCRASQISDQERVRSDSSARPDNIWGWPGYALQEIVDSIFEGRLRAAGRIAWQIFGEPTLANTYAPDAETVYQAINREMKRISWEQMFQQGEICAIRQTDDGRFAAIYLPTTGQNGQGPRAVIAPFLHLALGYPGICLTPAAQQYRETYGELRHVVQAYENHEHIYARLGRQGGVVILRGRGIVASRILHHLDEIRQKSGRNIQVIHLLRSPVTEQTAYGQAQRRLLHHRHVQPFNWPKSTFGGELREVWEKASPAERQELTTVWGGTTTSDRPDWLQAASYGVEEGWYSFVFGEITEIKPNGRNRLIIKTKDHAPPRESGRLVADYLFDCTGLNTESKNHPLMEDLNRCYNLRQNGSGSWEVSADFEVKPLRNGRGQVFTSGVMAAGNAFAPVDSFLGLQYAAQRSIMALLEEKAPGLRPLKGSESLYQWWRWVNGKQPG
jgi:hypothetical protein